MSLLLALVATAHAAEPVALGVEGHAYHPVWSPDGQRLVVEVQRQADDAALRVVRPGGDAVPIVLPAAKNPFSGASPIAMNPVWRGPDQLVFEGTDERGHFRVFAAGADGVAAPVDVALPGHLTFPSLDRVGDLAFVADGGGAIDVFVRSAGGELKQVTRTPAAEMFPSLAPDGGSIVYSRKVGATEDLFLLDLATGAEAPLAGGAGDQTRPARVDGGFVYFDGGRGAGHWDLAFVDPAGQRRILARDVLLPSRGRPAVAPSGRCVAYAPSGGGQRIGVVGVDGAARVELPTEQVAVGDVAVGERGGRTWLAWTGLPSDGAGWRGLWTADVTDQVRAACSSSR